MHSMNWFSSSPHEWIVDSRAFRHIPTHKGILFDYRQQHMWGNVIIDNKFRTTNVRNLEMFSTFSGYDQNLLSIHYITYTSKKVELQLDRWVVKHMNDYFKVVIFRYCDDSDHMYNLGKIPSSPTQNKFIAMISANDTSMLWCEDLGHYQLWIFLKYAPSTYRWWPSTYCITQFVKDLCWGNNIESPFLMEKKESFSTSCTNS